MHTVLFSHPSKCLITSSTLNISIVLKTYGVVINKRNIMPDRRSGIIENFLLYKFQVPCYCVKL
jgi:hypothetical protein